MIYFLCPDITEPSGGIKRLYRYVYHLNRLGFEAAVTHQKKGFTLDWHGYTVPIAYLDDRPEIQKHDILVFPEGAPSIMRETRHLPNKRVVLALSWAYVFRSMPEGHSWKDYGITHVITPSPFIKKFMEWTMDMEVTLIPDWIDTASFSFHPEKKKRKVSYMTRKSDLGNILRGIFSKKEEILSAYEWTPLENFDEITYARHLQESTIYLATSTAEGRNVSVLEAMASGCIVAGFSGFGGRDYMVGKGENRNCVMVEEGNWLELGMELEKIAANLKKAPDAYHEIITEAVETARRFGTQEEEKNALKTFFKSIQY